MNEIKNRIATLIRMVQEECVQWIQRGEDGSDRFIDPIDHNEISAHYGATHMAASLVIWGRLNDNQSTYDLGYRLMNSILSRWNENTKLPAYHFDFNNFAVSLSSEYVDDEITEKIKALVLQTPDSNHATVNWLPMRWFVNRRRYEWSNDSKYLSLVKCCKKQISKATNGDGGIEDRLPKGISFNLQYDVATVAALQFLRTEGTEIDLSKELGFLLNAVCPDGDINYQGRGTNQIFAWGMWIYLLATAGCFDELKRALSFLEERLPVMLSQHNLMLNSWSGEEKYLWWDYHYASVYTAHLLLWLVLAWKDVGCYPIVPCTPESCETGLHVYHNEEFFVSWFEGRREYLAEYGSAIACIWSKKYGAIFKGVFGPWQGAFGNKHNYEDAVIRNFCGLIEVKRNKDLSQKGIIRRFFHIHKVKPNWQLSPLFVPFTIKIQDEVCCIEWNNNQNDSVIINIPTLLPKLETTHLYVDSNEEPLIKMGAIRNQYALCSLYQSKTVRGHSIRLVFK